MLKQLEKVFNQSHKLYMQTLHKLTPNLIPLINNLHSTQIEKRLNTILESKFEKEMQHLKEEKKSQLGQDVLAKLINDTNQNFFVEFGATDGISLSNTYLLEQNFGWRGILAEPSREWHLDLIANRPKASIDFRAIWTSSGAELLFEERGELSSLVRNTQVTENKTQYLVKTVTLEDLLKEYEAPKQVSYLSVDIEGIEAIIMKSGFLDSYQFNLISVEHNFRMHRNSLLRFMRRKGYVRVLVNYSEWDDWFVSMKKVREIISI